MTAAKKDAKDGKKFNFGEAYGELEKIVEWFERDSTDLDESLEKFERGLELAQKCKERLKEVENKVVAIKAKFGEVGE